MDRGEWMKGKVLRVFNNDLYGKVDSREVILFAAFVQKKYMNNYAIFIFKNEYDKNELCYGSIHLKENSLVIFKVRDELKYIVDEFLGQYVNGQLVDYELIDINHLDKVEFVGYNKMDYDKILLLDKLSIPRVSVSTSDEKTGRSGWKFIIIGLVLIVGVIVWFVISNNMLKSRVLTCYKDNYNNELRLDYRENLKMIFDGNGDLWQYNVTEVYYFKNQISYDNFKNEGRQYIFFSDDGRTFEFIDEDLELHVIYRVKSEINDYSHMKDYLENTGYSCVEDVYDE